MMPVFYDTHAHLGYPDFERELPLVIERAKAAGISKIISIGTDENSSRKALKLAEAYDNVFAAVGWHPSDAQEAPEDIRPLLRELASHPKVVALGETGLDYYRLPGKGNPAAAADDDRYKARQLSLFQQHLEVAGECGLNCVIHQRECFEDTFRALAPFAGKVRGVFHCFANDAAAMQRVLALGSLVSFTGILTFKIGQNIRDTLPGACALPWQALRTGLCKGNLRDSGAGQRLLPGTAWPSDLPHGRKILPPPGLTAFC
jgi:TatD DNase family protein